MAVPVEFLTTKGTEFFTEVTERIKSSLWPLWFIPTVTSVVKSPRFIIFELIWTRSICW